MVAGCTPGDRQRTLRNTMTYKQVAELREDNEQEVNKLFDRLAESLRRQDIDTGNELVKTLEAPLPGVEVMANVDTLFDPVAPDVYNDDAEAEEGEENANQSGGPVPEETTGDDTPLSADEVADLQALQHGADDFEAAITIAPSNDSLSAAPVSAAPSSVRVRKDDTLNILLLEEKNPITLLKCVPHITCHTDIRALVALIETDNEIKPMKCKQCIADETLEPLRRIVKEVGGEVGIAMVDVICTVERIA